MKNQPIYLDNAATTPIDEEVLNEMKRQLEFNYGNPSSIHSLGRTARSTVEKARKTIAQNLGVSIGEIYFTSGGTEANNMAIIGSVRDLGIQHIITSRVEHPSVLKAMAYVMEKYNTKVEYVRLEELGRPDVADLREKLKHTTSKTLVSLMHANNELGTKIELNEIAMICSEHNALFHSDTVQTMGYYEMDFNHTPVSFAAASAHKFYGPKGVGFIYMSNKNIVSPLIMGGGQERGMRSGTENIAGIVGLAKAFEKMVQNRQAYLSKMTSLRAYAVQCLSTEIPSIEIAHPLGTNSHVKVIHLILPDIPKAELIVLNLDIDGICVSGGSACSSGAEKTSHVIDEISPEDTRKHLRVSISHLNTREEIDHLVQRLKIHLT